MDPLHELLEHGQSYWLDNLTRGKLEDGELRRRVEEEGLRGVTSNPSIFHKAITRGTQYDDDVRELTRNLRPVSEIYEELVVDDIRGACDVLRPVYDASDGTDGFVSLEVSPYLAHDAEGSIQEACRLNAAVDRPNVFIKIPGTAAGVPAIEECLYRGVNINITLLFSIESYEAVARAYIRALERRLEDGEPVDDVASVASFFLSRIDVLTDRILAHRIRPGAPSGKGPDPEELAGRTAVANAKLAYRRFREIFRGDRWERLAGEGARVQRMLWASTSTKDPLYSDVKYVEPLIGPYTVNTLPEGTIAAFADHGRVADTVEEGVEEARETMASLAEVGVDFDQVTTQLENEGVQKFIDPYDRLMGALAAPYDRVDGRQWPVEELELGDAAGDVDDAVDALAMRQLGRRVYAGDPGVWARGAEERRVVADRLGWLRSPAEFRDRVEEARELSAEIRPPAFKHVVHLGMGGSAEWPRAAARVLGGGAATPEYLVLDDTSPAAIRAVEERVDPGASLFVVASKSGTTVETLSLYRHFLELVRSAVGDGAPERFVAITDPDTPLAREARERGFRRLFENPEDVGGRYSAFTWFGVVPMALAGVDLEEFYRRAVRMQRRCEAPVPASENPAARLGAALGMLARNGRNKVTLSLSPELAPVAGWLRQLLAESTGKEGVGLVPVVEPELGDVDAYGDDRVFVRIRTAGADDVDVTRRLQELRQAGHPVVHLRLPEALDVAGELYRWMLATAVAGRVLGVNPFDEPNVAEAKRNTRELLEDWSSDGRAAGPEPALEAGELAVHSPDGFVAPAGGAPRGVTGLLRSLVDRLEDGGYLALLAFVRETPERRRRLTALARSLRDRLRVPVTAEFGPRYLHATGQLFKGGPPEGVFLLLTSREGRDVDVPGADHGFAILHRAQAFGDFRAMVDRGRPALLLDLGEEPDAGLGVLENRMAAALERGAGEAPAAAPAGATHTP